MASSRAPVIWPISSCCGSSWIPGWPRHVTMRSVGMRNGKLSEVSGLTALPRPEFWHIITDFAAGQPGARRDGDGLALARRAHVARAPGRR